MSLFPALLAAAGPVVQAPSWLTSWTLDPWQLVPTVVVALLYLKRVWTLEQEGRPVPIWRIWSFISGIVVALIAFTSPLHAIGEQQSMAIHMVEHLLLGDLVPLLVVLGLTRPLLRPILALPVLGELRILTHPLIALPLWAVDLVVWHIPGPYNAALSSDVVHAAQHISFLSAGLLMWASLFETLPGPAWFGTGAKIGYVVVIRVFGLITGNIFVWATHGFYSHYDNVPRLWGLSQAADQSYGGVAMMSDMGFVSLGLLAIFIYRAASESDQRQLLIERGLDPVRVKRAVRYGRARALALKELGYVPSRFQSEAPEIARPAGGA